MPNGNSPQIQIPLMAENDTLKYLLNNDGFNALDNAFNRILEVDMTAGDVTLTESQFTRNITFRCDGHAVPRTLNCPATVGSAPVVTTNRYFIVINEGAGDVTISGGAGANQAVGAGSSALVVSDGNQIYLLSRFVAAREFREEGVNQVTDPVFVNFVGNTVTAAVNAGGVDVTIAGVAVEDDGVSQTTDTTVIDFTGGGVTVTPTGSSAAVNIPGVNVEDEGVVQTTGAGAIDFLGTYVSVVNNAGTAEVTIGGLDVQEEGVTAQADPTFINFIGSGVTAATNGTGIDVTIVGGAVDIADEGVGVVTAATDFNFIGSGVAVSSPSAGVATIEIDSRPVKGFKGARLEVDTNYAATANAFTSVVFDSASYDFGGFTDLGGVNPNRITVPAGVTRATVKAHVGILDIATGWVIIRILLNGTELVRTGNVEFNGDDNVYVQLDTGVIAVSENDYFEIQYFTNVATADVDAQTWFSLESVSSITDTFETEGRSLGFAGWTAPGNIFTALNSGTPDTNAYDAGSDSWEIETVGPDGLGFATTSNGITGGSDFDVVFALKGRLPNDADAEIGVYYGNGTDQDRSVFLIDEAGQFRHDFYNTNTTFGSTNATDAIGRVYNDFPRHGVFYMRLTNTAGVTSMQYSSDGLEWTEVFAGSATENTMTNIDEVGLFFNSTNVLAGEIVKLRCVGYDVNGPQTEIITGLNAHVPLQLTGAAEVAISSHFHGNRTLYHDNAAASTYTINTGLTGTEPAVLVQEGAGQITVTAGGGVTLKAANGLLTQAQYSHIVITPDKFNADTYYISGDTVA